MLTTTSGSREELFYIGVRSSTCQPEDDVDYLSSSKLVESMLISGVRFKKDILFTYNDRESAEIAEQELFEQFECVNTINCINLHSYSTGCTDENTERKICFFKRSIPLWDNWARVNDIFRIILPEDLKYRIYQGTTWKFIGHPKFLKEYWPTTGTKVYWYGREDKLMSERRDGKNKYFVTDWSNVVGTPQEQIEILIRDHYVKGQLMAVLQEFERLLPLIDKKIILGYMSNIEIHKDHKWMIQRIKGYKK